MKRISRLFAAATLLCSTGLVAMTAQPLQLPDSEDPEIVVYGYPDDGEELSNFVSTVGAEARGSQLARWYGRICPDVVGLQEEFNNYVRQTIRSVAELADARLADEGCRHNVIVVMTDQPQAFIDDLREGRRDLFGSLTAREREQLRTSGDAVQVWNRIEIRGERGDLVHDGEVSYNWRASGNPDLPYPTIRHARASRISRGSRVDLDFRAIVIDLNQLNGQTMQQLSAFAAMLALGEFDVSEPIVPARTILNLFHDATGSPEDITDWDLAYLRALYDTSGGRDAHAQRGAMIRHITRQLSQSAED